MVLGVKVKVEISPETSPYENVDNLQASSTTPQRELGGRKLAIPLRRLNLSELARKASQLSPSLGLNSSRNALKTFQYLLLAC